jgi:hypothetical protein
MAKTVVKKDEGGSKFKGYGTPKEAVVRALGVPMSKFTVGMYPGEAVVAKDDKGEYVTSTYYVGKNLTDPFRFNRIIPPPPEVPSA